MQQIIFGLLVCSMLVGMLSAQGDSGCEHIFATNLSPEDKEVLCKLYQSSVVLSRLSLAVSNSMDQFIAKQLSEAGNGSYKPRFEKRKHEYLRFGRK